jgi:hypothetical protein
MIRREPSPELRLWVDTWRDADVALARIKRQALEQLDTREALAQLADAFDAAVRDAPRTTTSGLVEQQRLFGLLRK